MGEVCSLMTKSPLYCQYPIACLHAWIRPALLLGQFGLIQDRNRRSIGYLTWAYLSAATEERLVNDPEVLLHLSEWNEGERLWVLDMLIVEGSLWPIKSVLPELLAHPDEVRYLRRSPEGEVRKVVRWTSKTARSPASNKVSYRMSSVA
jgi:cytolysin-activating lysine-acyltransferase